MRNFLKMSNTELRKRIITLEAQDVARLDAAYRHLCKCGKEYYMGSGVVLSLTTLEGDNIIDPFMVADGFTDLTIQTLKTEIRKTVSYRLSHLNEELKNEK